MDPNFGTDKMLDPRFFGSKSPRLQCPASHFQGLHVLLATYGIPHGISLECKPREALEDVWLIPDKCKLCQSSSCARGAQILERKQEMGGCVGFLDVLWRIRV